MYYIIALFGLITYLWMFWGFYVLVMGIYRAHLDNRLTKVTLCLGLPFVVVGYVIDVSVNLTVASIIFLEPPQELLVTSRFQRYVTRTPNTWRGRAATWVCENLLDVFDPTGNHC